MPHIRVLAGLLGSVHSGSSGYHYNLVRELLKRGHQVSVVCFGGTLEGLDEGDIYILPECNVQNAAVLWRCDSIFRYWHYSKQLRLLNLVEPDFVIAGEHLTLKAHHSLFPTVPWFYIPHSYTVKHEIRSYQMDFFRTQLTCWLYSRLQKLAINNATATIRFTNAAGNILKREYGLKDANIIINPSGVFSPQDYEKTVKSETLRFVFVGRLVDSKNVSQLLECLRQFVQFDWNMNVIGDGPQLKELQDIAGSYGLSERVFFRGYQDDVAYWLRRADLFVSMSKVENFPLTDMESMSYGVPTLSMHHDGVTFFNTTHEFIESGVTGYLATDVGDFCQCLKYILKDKAILIELSKRCREIISKYYTWDLHIDRLENNMKNYIK